MEFPEAIKTYFHSLKHKRLTPFLYHNQTKIPQFFIRSLTFSSFKFLLQSLLPTPLRLSFHTRLKLYFYLPLLSLFFFCFFRVLFFCCFTKLKNFSLFFCYSCAPFAFGMSPCERCVIFMFAFMLYAKKNNKNIKKKCVRGAQ